MHRHSATSPMSAEDTLDFSRHEDAPTSFRAVSSTALQTPLTSAQRNHLDQSVSALVSRRLVTLVGPSGVGKSFLASEIARHIEEHSIFMAATVESMRHVDDTITFAKRVWNGASTLMAALLAAPEDTQPTIHKGLLVLDNCNADELHTFDCINALLLRWPTLSVLATARRPLGAAQEYVIRISAQSSMSTRAHVRSAEQRDTSQELLLSMVRSAHSGFHVNAPTSHALAQISATLNYSPQALQLIAPYVVSRGPTAILHDLTRMRRRRSPTQVGLASEESIQLATDWSVSQCSTEDRVLLQAISSFPGGCDVRSLKEILSDGALMTDIIARLSRLLQIHLVDSYRVGGDTCFEVSDHVRNSVETDAVDRGHLEHFARRQLQWCRAIVWGAENALITGSDMLTWMSTIRRHEHNLRAALQYALRANESSSGAQLACNMWRYWELTGKLDEGRSWIEAFLSRDLADDSLRIHLLDGFSMLAWRANDSDIGRRALNEALEIARRLGDLSAEARLHHHLGLVDLFAGSAPAARQHFDISLQLYDHLDQPGDGALVLANLALVAIEERRFDDARHLLETALVQQYATGDRHGWAVSLLHRAIAWYYTGERASALSDAYEAASVFIEFGDKRNVGFSLLALATTVDVDHPALSRDLVSCAVSTLAQSSAQLPPGWADKIRDALVTSASLDDDGGGAPRGSAPTPGLDAYSLIQNFRVLLRSQQSRSGRDSVQMLGSFHVRHENLEVALPPQVAYLVKLVALRDRPVHVEEAIEGLWPDVDPSRGHRRLRNVLSHLHRLAGPLVERRGQTLALANDVIVDVRNFREAANRALRVLHDVSDPSTALLLLRDAIDLYSGDLLPDDLYEPFTESARDSLRWTRLHLLDAAALLARTAHRTDEAEYYLRTALEEDCYNESRYIVLADLMLSEGRYGHAKGVALRAASMATELGVQPSLPVRELLDQLREATV